MRLDSQDKGNLRRATVTADSVTDIIDVMVWNGYGVPAVSEPVEMIFYTSAAVLTIATTATFGAQVGRGTVDTSVTTYAGTTEAATAANRGRLQVTLGVTVGAVNYVVKVGGLIFSGTITVV